MNNIRGDKMIKYIRGIGIDTSIIDRAKQALNCANDFDIDFDFTNDFDFDNEIDVKAMLLGKEEEIVEVIQIIANLLELVKKHTQEIEKQLEEIR